MRGVCGQIVAFAFVWFGMRHASQPIVGGLGSLTGHDRPVDCGREALGGLRCDLLRLQEDLMVLRGDVSDVSHNAAALTKGCEPVGSSDNGRKDVVQKTDSCGRLTAHLGKMAESTKDLVKTHVNIDFGSFLSRRTKCTFADSARRARHSKSQKDGHRSWHPTRQRS